MSFEQLPPVHKFYKGILKERFNEQASAEENLRTLLPEFKKFGIHIDKTCKVANTTLESLMNFINRCYEPTPDDSALSEVDKRIINSAKLSEESQKPIRELEKAIDLQDFNIHIGEMTTIGERVEIDPSVSIGKFSTIGKNGDIRTGAIIGDHCQIEPNVLINFRCEIGSNTDIQKSTTFEVGAKVPPYSKVVHISKDSTMAKIEPKFKQV